MNRAVAGIVGRLPSAVLVLALAAPAPADSDHRRFDQAREAFMHGHYRHAYAEFDEMRSSEHAGIAQRSTVAMAECQLTWGDYAGAIATLQPPAAAPPDDADGRRVLAAAHATLGNYTEAIEHGRQALQQDPDHMRARYELGRIYETLGRRQEALDTYRPFDDLLTTRFPETAVDAHYAGLGFYRYSVLAGVDNLTYRTKHVLQEVLQKACEVLDPSYWPARLAIADLLFEKYNLEEALGDYKAVLAHNPHCLEAHLGLAGIALDAWNFEGVEARTAVCLDLNPRSAETYVVLAALRMIERRWEDAIAAAEQALSVNPRHIEALSYLTAAQMRAGRHDDAERTRRRVYDLNPRPAVLHSIVAQQLSSGRQFPEAEAEFFKAIEFDPTAAVPRNELAMMYMQWGYEDKAREVVRQALDLDAFNARTYHTERLLDDLAGFASHSSPNFEIHFDARHDAVLGEYASEYLESIYEELCEDYDIELEDKTIIEFFPDHRRFGVRIHGKPWIHTVGACTGRVIAMDAPRRDVQGTFNFANVLRHEFTHTVTLAATRNRIPHWLTEGLAVLQEDRPKSWSWREMLAERLQTGTLFTLGEIDWGFVRPRRPGDRQVAYAQSEWMCEFIIERFGYDVINRMLKMYRDGHTQQQVMSEITGLSTTEFDRAFRRWALDDAQDWGLPLNPPTSPLVVRLLLAFYPESAGLRAQQANVLLRQGEDRAALEQAEYALELQADQERALLAAARASMSLAARQPAPQSHMAMVEQARDFFTRLAEAHPQNAAAAEFLCEYASRHDEPEVAERWATRLKRLQPLNPVPYRILSGIYLSRDDDDRALPELLELARHEEHDADVARQIARIYRQQDKLRAAASWYRNAIMIDPYDVPTHRRLAGVLDAIGDTSGAIREYRMMTVLEPKHAEHFNELAFAYHRAGRLDDARQTAEKAVALEPQSPARQLLTQESR